jgi:oxygen-independent coproporphyrinogen-3 oxidase
MIRELILQMKLGSVDAPYFLKKFGDDIRVRFAAQWADLVSRNLGVWSDDCFILTRAALLKVDTLLHPFFLPQHQNSRYT